MGTLDDVASVRSRRVAQWGEHTRSSAIAPAAARRDLTAIAVFSAIALFASLPFARLLPGGLSLIAQMP